MNPGVLSILAVAAAVLVVWGIRRSSTRQRSRALRATGLTEAERGIISRNVALYDLLPPPLREELEGRIAEFRSTKRFEGCGGLVLTKDIELTLAASACLLLLGRDVPTYPKLSSVLVYPSAFQGRGHRDQSERDAEIVRLGESWGTGAVILSWDDSLRGSTHPEDGRNVVLHEFAHQLDQADGRGDGTPDLGHSAARYRSWAHVLSEEFLELRRDTAAGRKSFMDAYGATNEAEFFAVATETFFESPARLRSEAPELYEELRRYYAQDPLTYFAGSGVGAGIESAAESESEPRTH